MFWPDLTRDVVSDATVTHGIIARPDWRGDRIAFGAGTDSRDIRDGMTNDEN
jgi:hypothetical protein